MFTPCALQCRLEVLLVHRCSRATVPIALDNMPHDHPVLRHCSCNRDGWDADERMLFAWLRKRPIQAFGCLPQMPSYQRLPKPLPLYLRQRDWESLTIVIAVDLGRPKVRPMSHPQVRDGSPFLCIFCRDIDFTARRSETHALTPQRILADTLAGRFLQVGLGSLL